VFQKQGNDKSETSVISTFIRHITSVLCVKPALFWSLNEPVLQMNYY